MDEATRKKQLAYRDARISGRYEDIWQSVGKCVFCDLKDKYIIFEENGIVHQIEDGTGITKYALCEPGCNCEIEQDLHLHFRCSNCNETVCLTEHKIPSRA